MQNVKYVHVDTQKSFRFKILIFSFFFTLVLFRVQFSQVWACPIKDSKHLLHLKKRKPGAEERSDGIPPEDGQRSRGGEEELSRKMRERDTDLKPWGRLGCLSLKAAHSSVVFNGVKTTETNSRYLFIVVKYHFGWATRSFRRFEIKCFWVITCKSCSASVTNLNASSNEILISAYASMKWDYCLLAGFWWCSLFLLLTGPERQRFNCLASCAGCGFCSFVQI